MPYYGYGYYFDPTYILVLIGVVISMIASARVKSTFQKYSRVRSRTNMTGAQAAQRVLNSAGIHDVTIRHVSGDLTDHYDPRNKTCQIRYMVLHLWQQLEWQRMNADMQYSISRDIPR